MYTLYGKKGSGSAAAEAALTMANVPFRLVETASWEPNDAFAELLKLNPLDRLRQWFCPIAARSRRARQFFCTSEAFIPTVVSCRLKRPRAPRRCAAWYLSRRTAMPRSA